MNTSYREFDTDSTSTPPSRSVRIARNSARGFTLIELLVVISIIALLSTVVLAALSDSRAKARNTAKNSLVLEYVKALELYRSDNNSYPVTAATPICFGYGSSETCYVGTLSGSDTIKSAMQNYLGSDFAHRVSVPSSLGDLKGIQYVCNGIGSCSVYTLSWVLEGSKTNCVDNATVSTVAGNRRCDYVIN
jgi:prepilin-type N-terminal cleavage/methylation domain-containing protein